ncbi:MAG TPA: WD40 repeat domain-containing serine/threonine protein kinase [Terriglobales bacterium]|jgi:serine/threonine protein kinase|nr:WD40 repeat domain-containing serine/threonine protein kinase [Terriglobales bacterium]
MTPERWQQIELVLGDVLELPTEQRSGFLAKVCSEDAALRLEVESFLALGDDEARTNFQWSGNHVTLAPGTKLGEYEIQSLLGIGGMGEVYRAHDPRLRRDVAVKVIPHFVSNDADRLRRFEQEARAAAALNHPNILEVHQLGMYEGAPYLVSELLEGETLREHLQRSRLALRKAIDYGVQIARGLAAAHEKGIVHRDLKPENLFITKNGRAKILDFGLAKLPKPQSSSKNSAPTLDDKTGPGVVLGTVGYMAPEQVRGQTADHRADIFAFGAILYEVLTGKRAFQELTSVETMGAILNEDPPDVSLLAPTTPLALQGIVQRCLEKNPEQRFQSASDLAFALEASTDSGRSSATVLAQLRKLPRKWVYGATAAAIVLAALSAILQLRPQSALVPTIDWVQITDLADSVTSPAFSPDGRMLTFLRGDDSFLTIGQVYVMLLPHGNPVRLTNDSFSKMSPVFSFDGANVGYTVPWDTWSVPVLGGQPRLMLPNTSGLSWLDADNLMFSQITSGVHMELVSSDLSRAHVHTILSPEGHMSMVHRSYLSPDRKWVITVEMTGNFWDRCRLIPFDGSAPGRQIGPADGICTSAAWSPDGAWMYLNTNSGRRFHVWRQRFPNGRIEQVTSGPTEEEGIAIDPDGKSFVTAVGLRRSSVWLHDQSGERMLTSEATAALAAPRNGSPFSLDGKKLYYLVRRTPGREYASDHAVGELWEFDLQSGATQAILPRLTIFDFSLSPDGRDVVYAVLRDDDTRSIWVAPLDRSSPARMLQADADHPGFTPSYVYYTKRALDGAHVHRVHPDGSGDEQIWDEKIQSLATSPDGRYLALTVPIQKSAAGMKHGQQWKLEVVDWGRKRVYPVCDDAVAYWSGDGKSFLVSPMGIYKGAPTYVLSAPADRGIPELPSNGISNITEFAKLKHVRTIPQTSIGIGRTPDTYAFVKETVQRNLYRIPLR